MSFRNDAPCTNICIRNNIFCRTTESAVHVLTDWRYGAVFDNNLYWVPEGTIYRYDGDDLPSQVRGTNKTERVFGAGPDEFARYRRTMGMDAASRYGEPKFRDEKNRDYRLCHGTLGTSLSSDGGLVGARNMPGFKEDAPLVCAP